MPTKQSTTTILGLPWVPGLGELAQELNLSVELLEDIIANPRRYHKTIHIPKRGHGYRELNCPKRAPKAIQAWILRNILDKIKPDQAATAYRQGMGLRQNVEPHKESQVFLCLDLVAFFDSITFGRVTDIFRALGYPKEPAELFAKFCTYKGHLPQGAVTSPALSNLACMRLDRRIRKYVRNRHVVYTRYADDITLSARNSADLFATVKLVHTIIAEEGFTVHRAKTRVALAHHRHRITGLVISDNHAVGVGRDRKRRLRAAIHQLERGSHSSTEARESLARHVCGWLAFIRSVDPTGADQLQDYWDKLR